MDDLRDEQQFHRDSDYDCLHNVAIVLRGIALKAESNPDFARLLWPTTRTWCKVEADRLIEIAERWVR